MSLKRQVVAVILGSLQFIRTCKQGSQWAPRLCCPSGSWIGPSHPAPLVQLPCFQETQAHPWLPGNVNYSLTSMARSPVVITPCGAGAYVSGWGSGASPLPSASTLLCM